MIEAHGLAQSNGIPRSRVDEVLRTVGLEDVALGDPGVAIAAAVQVGRDRGHRDHPQEGSGVTAPADSPA
jgi:hypothetical protein